MATSTEPEQLDATESTADPATTNGEPKKRPERSWQFGSVQASVFANEVTRELGPNQMMTRTIRNVRLERRFYNEKEEKWQSQPTYSLSTIHSAIAALQKAAAYLEEVEAESSPSPQQPF